MATGYTDKEMRDLAKESLEAKNPLVCKITWKDSDHDTEMYLLFCGDKPELDWVFSQDNASVEIIKPDTREEKIIDEAIKNTLVLEKIPHGHGSPPFHDCLTQHVRPKLNFRGRRNK